MSGEVIQISNGALVGDGPMIGGLAFSFGPTAVLRVAGIDILVVSERGQIWGPVRLKPDPVRRAMPCAGPEGRVNWRRKGD